MSSGLDTEQVRTLIVRPALKYIKMHSDAAENLVLGTALVESRLKYVKQLGAGPAVSVFQMEPFTHDDLWKNWIKYRPELVSQLEEMMIEPTVAGQAGRAASQMIGNVYYAAAMCRIHYRRVPAALPGQNDASGMAAYWKKYYNTYLGAGTVEKALTYFQQVTG